MDCFEEFVKLQLEIIETEKKLIQIQEKQAEIFPKMLNAISGKNKANTLYNDKHTGITKRLGHKEYFKRCLELAKQISDENPDEYNSPNSVLRYCYKRLDRDYSCGLEIKKFQFAKENGYTPKNTLDMISKFDGEWEIYRSVFLSILEGMCNNDPIVITSEIKKCETWEDFQDILREICGDTPIIRARLLRKVYSDMETNNTHDNPINWSSYRHTYRKRHNYPASRNIKKIDIISESRKLKSLFLESFNKVIDMERSINES